MERKAKNKTTSEQNLVTNYFLRIYRIYTGLHQSYHLNNINIVEKSYHWITEVEYYNIQNIVE